MKIARSSRRPPEPSRRGVETVSEAIVVVDIVDSTKKIIRHGWDAVGKYSLYGLRKHITDVGPRYGLCCRKSTGDGYLLAFRNKADSEESVKQALKAMATLSREIIQRNKKYARQFEIKLRFALHYGQVDAVDHDREGPTVSYAFRLEGVDGDSLVSWKRPPTEEPFVLPGDFPKNDYMVLSQVAMEILQEQQIKHPWMPLVHVPLKGFQGWHQLFLLRDLSKIQI